MSINNAMHRPEIREKCKGPRPGFMPHNHFNGWSNEVKLKISNSLKGHNLSDETKLKMKKAKANIIWIHRYNIKPKQIKKLELKHFLTEGWERGRGPRKCW